MGFETGIIVQNEKELMAWSTVLAMNNIVYFINIEKLDGEKVCKIHAKNVTNAQKDLLIMQYKIQMETIQNVML